MKIVERTPAHYEVQEVEDFDRSYKWCPEQIMLECYRLIMVNITPPLASWK